MSATFGSINNKCETDPVVNGGTYTFVCQDGSVEEGVIMGVRRFKGAKGEDIAEGKLYTFYRGPVPTLVREGTESFRGWTLTSAPAKSAAEFLKNQRSKPVAPAAKSKSKADSPAAAA